MFKLAETLQAVVGLWMPRRKLSQLKMIILDLYLLSQELDENDLDGVRRTSPGPISSDLNVIDKPGDLLQFPVSEAIKLRLDIKD